uniref:Uncharacterized protein n=1 Tax=Arundo donax TaxID=35708 RepID=A0A0A9G4Z0_ARUDO
MSGDHEFCFCSPNGGAAGPLLFPPPPISWRPAAFSMASR